MVAAGGRWIGLGLGPCGVALWVVVVGRGAVGWGLFLAALTASVISGVSSAGVIVFSSLGPVRVLVWCVGEVGKLP